MMVLLGGTVAFFHRRFLRQNWPYGGPDLHGKPIERPAAARWFVCGPFQRLHGKLPTGFHSDRIDRSYDLHGRHLGGPDGVTSF